MTQVVECLPNKPKALSSNPSPMEKKLINILMVFKAFGMKKTQGNI
jgi:hypothetical protein